MDPETQQIDDGLQLDPALENLDLRETPLSTPPADQAQAANSTSNEDAAATNAEGQKTADANTSEATSQATETPPANGEEAGKQTEQGAEGETARNGQADPKLAAQDWRERQRNRDRDQRAIEEQINNQIAPKTAEQFEEEGLDAVQARLAAIDQREAFATERARISNLNADLYRDSADVSNEFDVFNPNSPSYDKEFTEQVDRQYQQAARLQTETIGTNPDGSPIKVITRADVPLYDFYKSMHNFYNRGASKGVQQGQQQAQAMLSRIEDTGGSSSTNAPASGSLEDLEQRLGDVRIA